MLATAPPEDIERAHEEAFAKLTPEQRQQALQALAQHVPEGEIRGDDPASLARAATRAEIRQPGTIERAWGSGGAGFGLGSWFMTTLAASFIGTAIAQSFFDNDPGSSGDGQSADDGGQGSDGAETADAGSTDRGQRRLRRRRWRWRFRWRGLRRRGLRRRRLRRVLSRGGLAESVSQGRGESAAELVRIEAPRGREGRIPGGRRQEVVDAT